jgi:hypothetical protein
MMLFLQIASCYLGQATCRYMPPCERHDVKLSFPLSATVRGIACRVSSLDIPIVRYPADEWKVNGRQQSMLFPE